MSRFGIGSKAQLGLVLFGALLIGFAIGVAASATSASSDRYTTTTAVHEAQPQEKGSFSTNSRKERGLRVHGNDVSGADNEKSQITSTSASGKAFEEEEFSKTESHSTAADKHAVIAMSSRELKAEHTDRAQQYFRENFLSKAQGPNVDLKILKVGEYPKQLYLLDTPQIKYQSTSHVEGGTIDILHYIFSQGCKSDGTKGSLMLDMGTNEGRYALLGASYGCRVRTIEPQPLCVSKFAFALAMNEDAYRISSYLNAVHYKGADFKISVKDNECSGLANFPQSGGSANVEVKGITLDSLVEDHERVLILHLDTEGAEMNVLQSAEKMLSEGRIDNFIIEMGPSSWTPKYHVPEAVYAKIIKEYLSSKAGFRCFYVSKFDRVLEPVASDPEGLFKRITSFGNADYFCTKDSKFHKESLKSAYDVDGMKRLEYPVGWQNQQK